MHIVEDESSDKLVSVQLDDEESWLDDEESWLNFIDVPGSEVCLIHGSHFMVVAVQLTGNSPELSCTASDIRI